MLLTADPVLCEAILRLAAAVDVDLALHEHIDGARAAWTRAPLVLVGVDALAETARRCPRRRDRVVVVGHHDDGVWRDAVSVGAEQVLCLPDAERALLNVLRDAGRARSAQAPVLCVLGGCGGAGASSFAVSLARAAARVSEGVLLVDGDPDGGGLELTLDAEHTPGLRWRDLSTTSGWVSPEALRHALPVVDGILLLSHDRHPVPVAAPAWEAILAAGSRTVGLVIVDTAIEAPAEVAATILPRARWTLMVVPADVRAVAAARARLESVRGQIGDVGIVVRLRRDSDLDAEDVARALEVPLHGAISDARPASRDRIAQAALVAMGCAVPRRHRRFA